jgi:hypothetical protein
MEEAVVTSWRFVDPKEVTFTKTEYPPRGIDSVVSIFPLSTRGPNAGLFYITLYFRKSLKNKFQRKGILLQRNGDGAYLTHAAAMRDVLHQRIYLEDDYEEVSPGCWAEKAATPTKRARKGHFILFFNYHHSHSSCIVAPCARGRFAAT